MEFAESIAIKAIDAKHPDWAIKFPYWEKLRKLYEGEPTLKLFVTEFLEKNSLESLGVYNDRCNRFRYTNHLKTIIGWYTAALFKEPPKISFRKQAEAGGDSALITTGPAAAGLTDFQDDVDTKGTDLITWWKEKVQAQTLLYGKMYILFDLPVMPELKSKAQQNEVGALRPHLVPYTPQDVINWQVDQDGNLQWAIIKMRARTQESPFDPIKLSDRWFVFDTTQVAVYEYVFNNSAEATILDVNEKGYQENAAAKLIDGPRPHALSDLGQVPLFVEETTDTYHLGIDILSPLQRLVNLENGLDWSLIQGNLASLVVYSTEPPESIRRTESTFLHLLPGDKIEFLESSGRSYAACQARISEVREELYRGSHLVQQGRSSSASAVSQSGISKEADMMPARDVLSALGDMVRRSVKRVLSAVATRLDFKDVEIEVQGLDFPDNGDSIELENLERGMLTIDISGSPTLYREVAKRISRIMLQDASRELMNSIDQEWDKAPTPSEMNEQQQQVQENTRMTMLSKALTNRSMRDEETAE